VDAINVAEIMGHGSFGDLRHVKDKFSGKYTAGISCVETVNTSFNSGIMPYRISDPLKFNP